MSELDKLLESGGSQREDIQERNLQRDNVRLRLLVVMVVLAFLSALQPLFLLLLIPTVIGSVIYSNREWMG